MRLATFNVLHGRSLGDGRVSTDRLVDACGSLDADLLFLQEIDRNQARSGRVDQTEAVAKGTGGAAWRFEPALIGEPGGTWRTAIDHDHDGDEPGYGVGLVSRLPVDAWHVVRLAAAPVRAPVAVPGGKGRFIWLHDEPRVGLAATVDVGAGDALFATTHLSFVPGYNLVQLRRLAAHLTALATPGAAAVLAGDLNVPAPFPRWISGWRPLATAKTYPADRPSMQVDHVLARGDLPRVVKVEVRRLPLSDHRALVVELASGQWPS